MAKFVSGEVVVFKSGGPLMVVTGVDTNTFDVSCQWWGNSRPAYSYARNNDEVVIERRFPEFVLRHATEAEMDATERTIVR